MAWLIIFLNLIAILNRDVGLNRCIVTDILYRPENKMVWLDYPVGFDIPDDVKLLERLDFKRGGGLWVFWSVSAGAYYTAWFNSYTVDGEPKGAHDFCGVYRVYDY